MNASMKENVDRPSLRPLILSGHTGGVSSIAFLPDSNEFVSSSFDHAVKTWGATQGYETRPSIDCHGVILTMAVSNDGRWIATSGEKWPIALWDAETHANVGQSADMGLVESLSFSADGTTLASGLANTTVIIWSIPSWELLGGPLQGHADAVTAVEFSPLGEKLASTDLHSIHIRDSRSGEWLLPPIELEVWSLAWAPTPNDLLMYAACGNRICCIDTSTGAVCVEWVAHALTITAMALSRDGQLMATSSNFAKTVRVWNTTTQEECTPALEHGSFVRSLAVSPNGSRVIAGSENNSICVWSIRGDSLVIEDVSESVLATASAEEDDVDSDSKSIATKETFLPDERPHTYVERVHPSDLAHLINQDGPDPVASGGFADIYRGTLHENGRPIRVAIKAIKTYSGEDGNLTKKRKRLRREIKVWLNLEHVNVLPLLGTVTGFGRFPAMVCPWAENGALTSYLEHRHDHLTIIEILSLLDNVASGLHYLHSRSVVHGDLSGSNVLIDKDGSASIADFGLSMLLTELGGSTFATSFHARGTLRWTALELLDLDVPEDGTEGEPPHMGPTKEGDVYSFGGIMVQILTGKVPYHYYTREAQVVHAVSRGMTPRRPRSELVTERRWRFTQRCWTVVDGALSRPSSEDILVFTNTELVNASTT